MAIKILIDPGHGAGSAHNRGFIGGNEGDYNWIFAQRLIAYLEEYGFKVGTTRPKKTDNPSLESRGKMGAGYDLFLSNHTNAGGASGTEIYDDTGTPNNKLASMIVKATAKAMGNSVRAWSNAKNGVNYRYSGKTNYYGVLRNNRAKSGMLLEICFHDNKNEVTFYKNNLSKIAKAVADSIAEYYGYYKILGNADKENEEKDKKVDDVNLMGESVLNADELEKYFNSFKVTPKIPVDLNKFIQTYIDEGEAEGVRGDIAFIQSIHETGKFQFGGDVVPEQFNYAGIGTTGGGVKGHYFKNYQEGIRGQIQHLKAYASKESLKNKIVDPRFNLVNRGSATTVRALTGKWATDKSYGDKLMGYYNESLKFKVEYKKEKGGNFMDQFDYIIAITSKNDKESAMLLWDNLNAVITKNGRTEYHNKGKAKLIAVGGERNSHSSYADYFIAGDNRDETLEKAKDFLKNMEKYKAPKKK